MSGVEPTFARDDVLGLLRELGARLERRGVRATVYVVGGAAMAIAFDTRRLTRDIDAIYSPAQTVSEVASEIAAERHLPADWLNQSARAFVPTPHDPGDGIELPGLSLTTASPQHLLAMKLAAGRYGRDLDDLVVLFRQLGIRSPDEAVEIARTVYGDGSVVLSDPDESYRYLAEDVLRLIAEEDGRTPRPH